jgi:hypothetical protein
LTQPALGSQPLDLLAEAFCGSPGHSCGLKVYTGAFRKGRGIVRLQGAQDVGDDLVDVGPAYLPVARDPHVEPHAIKSLPPTR